MKKLLTILLALAMCFSFAACGKKEVTVDEFRQFNAETYGSDCTTLYNNALSDFYKIYSEARANNTDMAKRYADMAIAEAKLMEAAVMMPLYTRGGNYAISRIAPYTVGSALWGTDADRNDTLVVVTDFITKEDRAEMREKYNELKGTGTYMQWAKEFLTSKGYTIKDSYTTTYGGEGQTMDALATSKQADTDLVVDTYAGLLRYDCEGIQQPELATGYTVSEDGKTYTFTIRDGAVWTDSQGREIAPVTADDFVAGFQHMLDAQGGLEWLVEGVIVGASDYINGDYDFSKVGVKATDEHTLVYTLEDATPYFPSMLSYNIFVPMNRAFYESLGGKFGADYTADTQYGTSPSTIAYCGPFLITSQTENNSIVYQLNPKYWNAENVNVKTFTRLYNDGSDVTKAYNDAKAGVIDGVGLTTNTTVLAKQDGLFDKYASVALTEATTFMSFYNLNRLGFQNFNDGSVVSPQTANDANRTYNAMQNVHFRRALSFAYDRASSMAQRVGEELKLNALRNSYTPYNFVSLPEETTVKINGKDVTYPAGTFYGQIMQDQIDADGVKITVYDPEQPNGGDGFDGWYNPENAKAELDEAVKELKKLGFTVDAEHPIYIDLPYYASSEVYTNMANSYKQSVEAALGGLVIMNLCACETTDQWYGAGYDTTYGYEANYDIYDLSGWGPDYGDPSTYLDTMLPEGAGYMIKCIGMW